MVRVLFVCLGNICRSPMAEAVFVDKVRRAGLSDELSADSAGTGQWHVGEPAHKGTLRVLSANDIAYNGRARVLTQRDLDTFDYVIAMDKQNIRDIHEMAHPALNFGGGTGHSADSPRAQLTTLLSYATELGTSEVPDPYYTGRFEEVYRLVDADTSRLLEAIRAEHGL